MCPLFLKAPVFILPLMHSSTPKQKIVGIFIEGEVGIYLEFLSTKYLSGMETIRLILLLGVGALSDIIESSFANFVANDTRLPIGVIIMAQGRSGSSMLGQLFHENEVICDKYNLNSFETSSTYFYLHIGVNCLSWHFPVVVWAAVKW